MNKDIHKYDDIISMPHPVSKKHPPMPRKDRAAQFAPFAALTGHKEAIHETGRRTEEKRILDENQKLVINETLVELGKHKHEHIQIKVTYFVPDRRKAGGLYLDEIHEFKKLDDYHQLLVLTDGGAIPFDDIYEIEILE